ncbi:holo-ACP synthase [Arcanobacterium hippocoleae]|uniref:Holo-[acyl-carrier-protein] synthase n=1 Tax=Arcanobacterium hippocoleae TaxID=149017 RepID=A0ABU1T0Q7_9ACTO|nr:holo-ACP synthase [Arcanobacterium hippocoleae]MDR6938935.1 holo-[acyl-carrier protein] synthase [Arcanobacterium hippocoleae]
MRNEDNSLDAQLQPVLWEGSKYALGIGVDLVAIPDFLLQLNQAGSTFRNVFSAAELRNARRRAAVTGNSPDYHLAARWAGKEAFLKAWSNLLLGKPPVINPEKVIFSEIEVLADYYWRPQLVLSGTVAAKFRESLEKSSEIKLACTETCDHIGRKAQAQISLSHDGEYAIAYVQIALFPCEL